jgi:hypothetical protein
LLVPTPSPVQPHHDVHSVASHVSGGLAGVRAFRPCWGHRRAASSAHLKTDPGSQQEADIVHVREGDTDAWPSIPFAPSWAGTQCSQQGGVQQRCNPAAVNGVQCRGSSPEEASRHCIACRQAGAVASSTEYVVVRCRHRSRPSVVGEHSLWRRRVRKDDQRVVVPRRWGSRPLILGHEPLVVVGGFEHVAARQQFYKCPILSNFGFSN